jgi:uncharacterized protein YerC
VSCTGTSACYARGCRNEVCRAANKARYLKRERNGNPAYRSPLKARRHIEALLAAGMSHRQIEKRSGVNFITVKRIRTGEAKRILDRTEKAILATRPAADAWCYVDAKSTIARIEHMRTQGYSKEWIAEKLGMSAGGALPKPGNRKCRAFIAKRVMELAELVEGCVGVARDGRSNGRRALSNEQRIATHRAA